MAKRADPNEKPFQPIEHAYLKQVLEDGAHAVAPDKVVNMNQQDVPTAPTTEPKSTTRPGAPLTWPIKFRLEQREYMEYRALLTNLSNAVGTTITISNLQRAVNILLRNAENQVLNRAEQERPLRRPANDDRAAVAALEWRLAKVLAKGFRDAPPLRE